jgi:hypothetical protein
VSAEKLSQNQSYECSGIAWWTVQLISERAPKSAALPPPVSTGSAAATIGIGEIRAAAQPRSPEAKWKREGGSGSKGLLNPAHAGCPWRLA